MSHSTRQIAAACIALTAVVVVFTAHAAPVSAAPATAGVAAKAARTASLTGLFAAAWPLKRDVRVPSCRYWCR